MPSINPSDLFSILIIKTSSIGDVIQTFPVLEYLRKKHPHAHIDWVVEQGIAPLLKAHPLLDHVIEVRAKAWRKAPFSSETKTEFSGFVRELRSTTYDVLFDLQGNTKSAVVTGSAKAKVKVGFGWKCVREKSNLLVTNKRMSVPENLNVRLKYLGLVQKYFDDFGEFNAEGVRLQLTQLERERLQQICSESQPRLMVCFGSKWANKRLDNATLTVLLEKIAKAYAISFLFIFSDDEEQIIAENLAAHFGPRGIAIGNLSLPLWQAMMWEVAGVIAVDSASLHLCGTTQTPSFSIFGPSLASSYKPIEERHTAVQGECPYGRTFPQRCPILRTCPTGACIRQLTADDLFSSFENWASTFLHYSPFQVTLY
jgi:heptosyltransferase I